MYVSTDCKLYSRFFSGYFRGQCWKTATSYHKKLVRINCLETLQRYLMIFCRARCYSATASLPITPWGSEEILYLAFAHKETTSFRLFYMGLSIIEQEAEAKGSQIISDQTMAVPNTLCQSKKKRVRICNALSLCPLECEVAGSLGIHHQSADSQVHSRLTLPPRSAPVFPDSQCYDVPRRLQVLGCHVVFSLVGLEPCHSSSPAYKQTQRIRENQNWSDSNLFEHIRRSYLMLVPGF